MTEIILNLLFPMSVFACVSALINLWLIRQNRRQLRQWKAMNEILLHLCVGAFLLRLWPLRHLIEIEHGPEPAPRRFWQRWTPKP